LYCAVHTWLDPVAPPAKWGSLCFFLLLTLPAHASAQGKKGLGAERGTVITNVYNHATAAATATFAIMGSGTYCYCYYCYSCYYGVPTAVTTHHPFFAKGKQSGELRDGHLVADPTNTLACLYNLISEGDQTTKPARALINFSSISNKHPMTSGQAPSRGSQQQNWWWS
jgi:hypothetical protein